MWPARINNDLQKALTDQILTPEFSHLQKCLGESITTTVIKTLRLLKKTHPTHTQKIKLPNFMLAIDREEELNHKKTTTLSDFGIQHFTFSRKKAFSSPTLLLPRL